MATIRKRDTRPELIVRRLAWSMGYRYRLYRRDLPGMPDLVFAGRRKAVLVHGCFWHRHACPAGRKTPSANPGYWGPKLARNVARDIAARAQLEEMGWTPLIVWECEARNLAALQDRLAAFLA